MPRSNRKLLLLLCLTLLLPLAGCKQVKEERKNRVLESATSGYRQAIRWGYHDAALQFVEPKERPEQLTPLLENVRVTGYEVVRSPVIIEEDKAEQIVRIEYVLRDRQRLESLTDRQRWLYDKETSNWWLTSGLPKFKTD
ncbi:hypothetical protein Thiosp_00467 [Thiorhodovibrio litoralis]|uniref:hypothetical protein n=1 Tax=Thiorhodovibrio winogradskyi TaxID=77007 RepID=UPI001913FAB3|nr:hypothetical protein [Thiorhodovibrio winogradskyi]MBK5970859.1 hypothetical protein [Thiorhodovibrio winogradskyi]WPL10749.1 hypothetical protein Thiosp_00467 [Thiorhodovibrio litoralis]